MSEHCFQLSETPPVLIQQGDARCRNALLKGINCLQSVLLPTVSICDVCRGHLKQGNSAGLQAGIQSAPHTVCIMDSDQADYSQLEQAQHLNITIF